MFRVMQIHAEGAPVVHVGDAHVGRPDQDEWRWVDLEAQDEATLAVLRERFGFHPLALEDCAHVDQRSKVEEYGDHVFVVTHGFSCPSGDPARLDAEELHAFLGEGYLVTVHMKPIAALESVWGRLGGDVAVARRGPDFAYYLLLEQIVDQGFPVLDALANALEEIETAVVENPRREHLQRLSRLRRSMAEMRHLLSPQRDVYALLSRSGDPRIAAHAATYFRDVYDHAVRVYELLEIYRDLATSALEAYLSAMANRTNDIMRQLTILSAIFLPLTFITGFFGQNFTGLPFASSAWMAAAVALCLVVPAFMIWQFRRRGWL